MGYMVPFPGFDAEEFPFIIVQGKSSVGLLNVKTGYFEPLIITNSDVRYNQQPFFFQETEFGVKLNFQTSRGLFNGNKRLEWA